MKFIENISMLNIHLVISVLVVVPVALLYGFSPALLMDVHVGTVDENNLFKGIMSLYLCFSILWVIGIINEDYLKSALVSNVVFMFGLAFGRTVSVLIDGLPTFAYVLGIIVEFALGFFGLWVLKNKNTNFVKN